MIEDRPGRMDPNTAFAELDTIVLGDKPLQSVLETLVELAKRVLPPTVETSVTLIRDDQPSTAAYTHELALDLDKKQYEHGHGPCVDSANAGEVIHVPDMAEELRWPEFATAAREAGISSSLSIPLPVQRQLTGALNIYSREGDIFDDDALELTQTFASHAAVAVANAQLFESTAALARQLRDAMTSRAVIEQAKGIIMRDRGCAPDAAFEALVKLSQESHRKLRDVATMLVDQVSQPPPA